MAKKKQKTTPERVNSADRVVSENRRARHEYNILDSLECGMVLVGSEVKSLRNGTVSLSEAFARIKSGEVWLYECDIPEYFEAGKMNHKPKRPRKLLLHKREIDRFARKGQDKGLTLVPLRLYFKEGRAKVLLGLCQGKQEFDKRQSKKEADAKRGLRLSMMKRR